MLIFGLFCVILVALVIYYVSDEVAVAKNPGLRTLLDVADRITGVHVRQDYSGRCMNGASCVGLAVDRDTTPIRALGVLIEDLVEQGEQDALCVLAKLLQKSQVDDLGLGKILYFPDVQGFQRSYEESSNG